MGLIQEMADLIGKISFLSRGKSFQNGRSREPSLLWKSMKAAPRSNPY